MNDDFEKLIDYLQEWKSVDDITKEFTISRTLVFRRMKQVKSFYKIINKKIDSNKRGNKPRMYKIKGD